MARQCVLLAVALLAAGCGPFVSVTDLETVPPAVMAEASRVRVYQFGTEQEMPQIAEYLGPVEAYSCKNLLTDPPASKGDALQQLRIKAAMMEADAIIDVNFDERGTDAWGTNCWETVQASGMAVRLANQQARTP